MKSVLITGADRGLGLSLTREFLQAGFHVFAGQYMPSWSELAELAQERLTLVPLDITSADSQKAAFEIVQKHTAQLDMLINNAGIVGVEEGNLVDTIDTRCATACFEVNCLGALNTVKTFLPLMANGMKRLCFVSSEAGSISATVRTQTFGYCMSKAALNMSVKLLFNELQPKGFTFRLYQPGWMQTYMEGSKNLRADITADHSAKQAIAQFLESRDWEDALVMLDYQNAAWPF